MHSIEEGAASKSFGLQVAQLAGVPKVVINRAKQRLSELESQKQPSLLPEQTDIFEAPQLSGADSKTLEMLDSLDVNDLSPKQALDLLFELKSFR
jgi:DNA mismatch repair protein MutS